MNRIMMYLKYFTFKNSFNKIFTEEKFFGSFREEEALLLWQISFVVYSRKEKGDKKSEKLSIA